MKRLSIGVAAFILTAVFIAGCSDEPTGPGDETLERGGIYSSVLLYTVTPADIEQAMSVIWVDLPFPITNTVDAYRIVYSTIDTAGQPVRASGTIMVPQGVDNLPLMSFHHQINTERDYFPLVDWNEDAEGIVGVYGSSIGYLMCQPDYLGLGVSEMLQPFLHARSYGTAIVDFLRAVRNWCADNEITLSDGLVLTGWDEGAYATLAVQREIEANYASEFTVTASAPLSGYYDLMPWLQSLIEDDTYDLTVVPALLFRAYDEIYGWGRRLEIFNQPYGTRVMWLFTGDRSLNYVLNNLPFSITELLAPDFIDGLLDGSETEVIAALDENSLLGWAPVAPIRIFHGGQNEYIPIEIVEAFVDSLNGGGGTTAELVTVVGGNHEGGADFVGMFNWFDTMLNGTGGGG